MTVRLDIRRSLVLTAAVCALSASGASAQSGHRDWSDTALRDLRSPDTRDVATPPPARTDLRSPDTRDVATPPPARTDLRSPDRRDVMTAWSFNAPDGPLAAEIGGVT